MKRSLPSPLRWAVMLCCLFAIPALADSNARMVRLSDVQGSVQIDRGTGRGFEKAFLNMPLTQGVKLRTGDDGRAEIEFEDNTLIHAAPKTTLQFTELSLREGGAKLSTVDLGSGEAYVNFSGKKDDEFTLTFGHEKTTLTHAAHFRVNLNDEDANLAVLKGDVEVSGPSGEVKLSKKQTATFDLNSEDKYTVAKNVEEDPFDAWDKHEDEYHQRYQASNSYGAPYDYGFNDLNYYGNYMMVPGYGMMWQPYFAGPGWDPFMDGAWMFYPGFGYSWVSAYPWGWAPYHYGSWAYLPAYGWMWQPGANWVAWNRIPPVINAPHSYVPPRPPAANQASMVAVGRGPTASSTMPGTRAGSKVVVNRPTAGIGVPRGIADLRSANRDFSTHGQARVAVPRGPQGSAITAAPVDHGGRAMSMPPAGGHWGSMTGSHMGAAGGAHVGGAPHK